MKNQKRRKLYQAKTRSLFKLCLFTIGSIFLVLTLSWGACAQKLPSRIRGYTVYPAAVSIVSFDSPLATPDKGDAYLKLAKPYAVGIGVSGITIEIGGEITVAKHTGRIDFVDFRDFRANGMPVKIEEYDHSFSFEKGKAIMLPEPVRITIPLASLPRAVYHELVEDNSVLMITGTVLVFGKFKKLRIGFKRVVPITIDMGINNPLHS